MRKQNLRTLNRIGNSFNHKPWIHRLCALEKDYSYFGYIGINAVLMNLS